jgi:phage shock protein PspC (stress-responsive transcriptional regulator)
MGVCGGIAHTYAWRPNTMRLAMVILALCALLPESDEF